MGRFQTRKWMLNVAILRQIDDALRVDGAKFVVEGLHILVLYS
jgi:hypothetical protein